MRVGVQFTGTVPAGQTRRWFTFGWPAAWHVVWNVVTTAPVPGNAPEVQWDVQVERGSATDITYWVNVTNLTASPLSFEARYAVLN